MRVVRVRAAQRAGGAREGAGEGGEEEVGALGLARREGGRGVGGGLLRAERGRKGATAGGCGGEFARLAYLNASAR